MIFWCLQISPKANQILGRYLPYEEICQKFGWIFGRFYLKTPKIYSQIKWPLGSPKFIFKSQSKLTEVQKLYVIHNAFKTLIEYLESEY